MDGEIPNSKESLLVRFVDRVSGREKAKKIRLSPLKILLYLESRKRHERVTSIDKLKDEVGIGGYDTIRKSFGWLLEHKYIAPAPNVPVISPSEILDPQEFVVTSLGRRALRPFLATFSLNEVLIISTMTMVLGLALGPSYAMWSADTSYSGLLVALDLIAVTVVVSLMLVMTTEARERHQAHVVSLIQSVIDRDRAKDSESEKSDPKS